jgi:type II secretion system protein G
MKKGFTLIELMVVIVILGILVSIGTFAFQSSQQKSRDARRKADLYQVTRALEMYENDNGAYPAGGTTGADTGKIIGCGDTPKTACEWGGIFSNTTKATYMIKLPKDPKSDLTGYYYESVGKGYRLYARLENSNDAAIPTTGSKSYSPICGVAPSTFNCNYVLSSPNVVDPTPKP